MGCLTAPFKLIGCLGLIALLGLGWLYRDRLVREGRRLLGDERSTATTVSTGRPGVRALRSARAKIDSLNGWRADSVVLSPAEVASLIGGGLDPALRRQLDSLQIRLLDGEVAVQARLRTARLPREAVGPLLVALRDTEPIEATGPLLVVEPGRGEWRVRSFRIRDFPVPDAMVPRLIARALGQERPEPVPVQLPAGIAGIRLRPDGATLYGVPAP